VGGPTDHRNQPGSKPSTLCATLIETSQKFKFDSTMPILNTFSITDDSGFLAIVNSDKYSPFVNKNWELPELMKHFVDQMNNEALIIWATGAENEWTVNFVDKPTDKYDYKKFDKIIEVTNGQLFLTNYEDLTMAAQFKEDQIPSRHNSSKNIGLDNGTYNLTIRQLFDPTQNDYELDKISFEIVVQPTTEQNQKIDKIFWLTQ